MQNTRTANQTAMQPQSEGYLLSAPTLALPKAGGSIRGIGEKFGANPVTGVPSLTIPIMTTPARAGISPQLALAYAPGSGNGLFGLEWHLSLPNITRRTDKGLPLYQDASESDTFLLSDAEDLVPALIEQNGAWQRETYSKDGYQVQRYRPRACLAPILKAVLPILQPPITYSRGCLLKPMMTKGTASTMITKPKILLL